jgi:hypothetical protein
MLTQWCRTQISLFHKNKLTSDKIQLLKEINFNFDYNSTILDKIWLEKYERLVEYKKRFGDCNVPKLWKEDSSLASWVRWNRRNQKRLSRVQYNKLDELGFTWICKPDLWDNNIAMLKQFIEKHGHCEVPKTNKLLSGWLHSIRSLKKLNRLTEDKIKELNELEFDWDPNETAWEKNYQLLVDYKNEYGNCKINRSSKHNNLYNWCLHKRQNRLKLPKDKFNKLDELGFDWDLPSDLRDNYFVKLKQFKEKHGHCDVNESNDKSLAQWIQYLRKLKRLNLMNRLTVDEIKEVNELGFDWDPNETFWEKNYQKLVEYKKRFGHCNVPIKWKEDGSLGRWVFKNRKNQDKLSLDKYNKLNELGFNWIFKPDLWDNHIAILKQYKEKHGHCEVPKSTDKLLARWISYLRKIKKSNLKYRLTEDKIKELNELGFDWDPDETAWEEKYQLLVDYKNEHGNCNVIGYNKHKNLIRWCLDKRKNKLKLPKDKFDKLDELGFDWGK